MATLSSMVEMALLPVVAPAMSRVVVYGHARSFVAALASPETCQSRAMNGYKEHGACRSPSLVSAVVPTVAVMVVVAHPRWLPHPRCMASLSGLATP